MRDHDGCEEAILAAMRNDRSGKAEFLAAWCDIKHGHLKAENLHERVEGQRDRPSGEQMTTAASNGAALSEEDA